MPTKGQPSVAVLFRLLQESPETTRTDLVRLSGLSKATVSETIADLIERGFISERGKRQPARGRSQVIIEFNPQARLVLGAQFTDHGCQAVLTDLRARPVASAERPLSGTSPDQFIDALVQCVEELRAAHPGIPVIGLGVGVPGLVDSSGRHVIVSVPFNWSEVPLSGMLEARLGLPVRLVNRAKAAALGEYWQGEHKEPGERDNLAYVFVGAGIVCGLVFDGQPYFGSGGAAGEIGHLTVVPDGPLCGCGNRGCLHMLASESAIVRAVRSRLRQDSRADADALVPGGQLGMMTLDTIIAAAEAGNTAIRSTVEESARYLGIAIANLVNLVNPSVVVIGGPVAGFGDVLIDTVRAEVRQRALWDALHGVRLVLSNLGDSAGAIGAAALLLDPRRLDALLDATSVETA